MSRPPIPVVRELTLPVPPEALWPEISNTNRLNRAVGIPAQMKGEPAEGYSRMVSSSLFGLPLRWKELPFEWIDARYFKVVREFASGPIARFEGGMELAPEGSGTKLRLVSEFTPRGAVGDFLIRHVIGKKALDDAERVVREIGDNLARGSEYCFPAKRTKTPLDAGALARRGEALKAMACDERIVARLLEHLERAHDDELASMRPFELAERWGFDRLETLKTLLHAVKAGLADLSWHVVCPNCSGSPGVAGLSEVKAKRHCESCGVEYGADFGESVELRFGVARAVRPVEDKLFCVGSPAHARVACAQFSVPAGGRTVELELRSESYTVRDLCGKRSVALRPSVDGPSSVAVAFDERPLAFKPGRVRLDLPSLCASALVRIERESWKEKAAKATIVTSLQDFRALFSSEVLAPGIEISVKNIALLFTDLKGSTAMYERVGDATAYAIVRDHFDYLFEIVARRKGAVVKTIGDAVMACFSSASDALEAALEMQERVGELNKRLAPKPPVVLKIGVHQGPAIAINTSGVLDYFGTTANVAARVQNESVGGDIVVTGSVAEDLTCSDCLDRGQWRSEPFQIQLKGLSDVFTLRRMTRKA